MIGRNWCPETDDKIRKNMRPQPPYRLQNPHIRIYAQNKNAKRKNQAGKMGPFSRISCRINITHLLLRLTPNLARKRRGVRRGSQVIIPWRAWPELKISGWGWGLLLNSRALKSGYAAQCDKLKPTNERICVSQQQQQMIAKITRHFFPGVI